MPAQRILANSGFNIAGMAASTLVALLITPFLLANLGNELFGVWALFGVIVTGAQLLDLGMSRALVRDVAQYRSQGRWSLISRDFNSVGWPLLGLSVLIVMVSLVLTPQISRGLGVPLALQDEAAPALRLLFASLPLSMLALLLGATHEGAQKMAITSAALTLNRFIFGIGAAMTVLAGFGLMGVTVSYLLAVSVQVIILAAAVPWVTPSLRVTPRLCHRPALTRAFRFGRHILLSGLVALLFTATNKLALSHGLGLSSVAYYELATVVALQLFNLAMAIGRALYPAMAASALEGGLAGMQRLYVRATRLLTLLILPLGAGLIAIAQPLVEAWLGAPLSQPAQAMQWLVLAWMFASIAVAAAAGLQGLGRPGVAAAFSIYNAVLNLILVVILVRALSFWGIIAANVAAVSTSALLTILAFANIIALSWRKTLFALAPAAWVWVALLALVFNRLSIRLVAPHLWELVLLGAGFVMVYGIGILVFDLLDEEESRWLRAMWAGRSASAGSAS